MVNRQILVFEVTVGRKSMIRPTGKIPPILVGGRSFLRVVSAIDVVIVEVLRFSWIFWSSFFLEDFWPSALWHFGDIKHSLEFEINQD